MKDENELPITNTMRKDKRNSASQDDWRDYAYGGKSLLDDTQENTDNENKPIGNSESNNTTVNEKTQDDWRDYAYGGKSLLDDTQENTSNKKAEKLEKKRNLVIGYVQPIENAKNANTEKRTKAEDLESTQH